jgi:hypothetical protein
MVNVTALLGTPEGTQKWDKKNGGVHHAAVRLFVSCNFGMTR